MHSMFIYTNVCNAHNLTTNHMTVQINYAALSMPHFDIHEVPTNLKGNELTTNLLCYILHVYCNN